MSASSTTTAASAPTTSVGSMSEAKTSSPELSPELRKAANLLKNASAVLLAAGAGMSVPSGIDYNDTVGFKLRYPGLAAMGFRCCYEMIGQPLEPEHKWGYAAVHSKWMMNHGTGDKAYEGLKQLVGDKPYFVITTNVDGMFARNGFAADRIYTPQGSYTLLQCLSPSCKHVYDSRPTVASLLESTDLSTTSLTDLSKLPVCPKCKGDVYFNLNGGKWYINAHWEAQRKKFSEFIEEHSKTGRIVIIEIGVGYNTPAVIRWPMEKLAARNPQVDIIRVNLDHLEFDVEGVLEERAAPLGMDASSAIFGLLSAMKS